MKEKLTNNLSLKIVAVLISTMLWLISININDPYQSKDYTVTVQLQNINIMTNAGKYVEVAQKSDEISVRVRGSRSVMDTFTASNIVAVADLNELDEKNRIPIKLTTTKTDGNKIERIHADQEYVTVTVEDLYKIQKRIEVVTKNIPQEGYILGKTTTEQNALSISGPESLVNTVGKATVTVDLAGATDDVSMLLPIELYDLDGKRIIDSRLTASINQVQCVANILATKEVPIVFEVQGQAAKGYQWTGKTISEPSSVLIAAKPSVIKSIQEITVAKVLDISGAKSDLKATVDIDNYLPTGVSLGAASFDGNVTATAYIEKVVTESVQLKENQIEILNLPNGKKSTIENLEEILTIEMIGGESSMNLVKKEEINGSLDIAQYMSEKGITKLKNGNYKIKLNLSLPAGVELKKDIYAEIVITE